MKRAILFIATVILGLVLTGNSFAQDKKTIVKKKAQGQGYVLKDVLVTSYNRKRNKTSTSRKSKPRRSFSSQTQPHADGLVLERRRKPKKNLLPYMEQSNLRKKAKGKRNK